MNKKIEGWTILLQYEKEPPYVYEFNSIKRITEEWYKEHRLYAPEYTIIPCTISYSLPKKNKVRISC